MEIRSELVEETRKYFVGPRKDDEILPPIPNYPIDYYVLGILFPRNAEQDSLDLDNFETNGYKDNETQTVSDVSSPKIKQNSIGLRVDIKDDIYSVDLEIDFAKYKNTDKGWKRIPLDDSEKHHVIELSKKKDEFEIIGDDGERDAFVRWILDEGVENNVKFRVLNVFLENAREWKEYDKDRNDFKTVRIENNEKTLFQPMIKIHGSNPPFRNYRSTSLEGMPTAEDKALDLIYRNTMIFGEGSQCAADWERKQDPLWVRTDFVPSYTAPFIGRESESEDDGRPSSIDIHSLSYADNDDDEKYRKQFEENIGPIVSGYAKWLDDSEKRIESWIDEQAERHEPAAKNNIKQCRNALKRMDEGLKFLLAPENKRVRLAFSLANRSMLYQRLHYEYSLKKSKGIKVTKKPEPTKPGQAFWYPFQIAFFLMNIEGIVRENSPDRSTVDLLWFPTGGGKTEAYLAVAAFTMIWRRMKGDDNDGLGVSVMMRYTLRLLTLQQFERASTLICALEFLRINNRQYGLGTKPFLIGLWVGYGLTPNSYQQSDDALKDLRGSGNSDSVEGSPVQLIFCPWCGKKITPYDYAVNNQNHWTIVHCGDKDCFFNDSDKTEISRALPVVTVDFDIYRRCPSMIIATADKFARMAYRPEISSLFGRVEKYCERHGFLTPGIDCGAKTKHSDGRITRIENLLPPDLIIQDELHLITGPLGSMVGLYETAVDYLSRRRHEDSIIKPKVIVSTATIRGIDNQVRKLFNRKAPQKFPPPGTDRNDSYFWWESTKPGRQYVGVSFSHRSAKYALAKLYASLLQKVQSISNSSSPKEIDPYWTLVGYFNSIRELGGAIRLVEDDVASNIVYITSLIREFANDQRRDPGGAHRGLEELTGRVTQNGIRNIRENLEKTKDEPECINVLLATNMISVGIDIDRLGMMVVNGQPKNTSEYIQATGRIGRRKDVPGLIFTLYNPYKARDLSHYETFLGHHMMLQKYVEPSTLTPYSVGSIERGLHAVMISMIRLSIPRLSQKKSADNFEASDANEIKTFILERFLEVQQVGKDDENYRHVKKFLDSFVENWEKFIDDVEDDETAHEGVWYNNPYRPRIFSKVDENPNTLLIEYAKKTDETNEFPKATPESLRNVEKEIRLKYY